jgi:outer membrane lipoprotein-sorting protein
VRKTIVRRKNTTAPNTKIRLFLVDAAFLAMTMFAVGACAQASQQGQTELTTPLESLRPGVTANQIFDQLLAHNALRTATLLDYTAFRTYQVVDLKGQVHAEEQGRMEYRAPDQKKFEVTSERGSGIVRRLALNPLIASEINTATGKEHHDSAISPANYTLELLGEQQVGPYHCFVAQATPKRRDKYLFEGKVWVDAADYAVVRIEGHPAKKLSFWIERADFVRQYQKIGSFWLPQKDMTLVEVRLYGKKALTIDHRDYSINNSAVSHGSVASANTKRFGSTF